MHNYEEGDVVVVDLGKSLGHEQKGRRPSIIIANPQVGGKTLGLVVIIPLTTKEKNWWTMVKIEKGDGGVKNDCFVMCHLGRFLVLSMPVLLQTSLKRMLISVTGFLK